MATLFILILLAIAISGCEESGNGVGFSTALLSSDSDSGGTIYYSPHSSGTSLGTSTYYDSGSSSGASSGSGSSGGSSGGDDMHANPEPSSLALLGAGLFGLLGAKLRKRRGKAIK